MFPRLLFRVAYDWLLEHHPTTADRQYLKILEMAAMESEERVHEVLRHRIDKGLPITVETVREQMDAEGPVSSPLPVRIAPPEIRHYDALLDSIEEAAWL